MDSPEATCFLSLDRKPFPRWGVATALRRPHKGMRIVGCRASEVRERAAPQAGNKRERHNPLPALWIPAP